MTILRSASLQRTLVLRAIRQKGGVVPRRFFAVSARPQADLVQNLYLDSIKTHQPSPVKPSDADGHVQKFAIPPAPSSPEEANLSNDLKAYEEQPVEVEGQAAPGEAISNENWFEEPDEEEPAPSH